jgi:hypothetical protein
MIIGCSAMALEWTATEDITKPKVEAKTLVLSRCARAVGAIFVSEVPTQIVIP